MANASSLFGAAYSAALQLRRDVAALLGQAQAVTKTIASAQSDALAANQVATSQLQQAAAVQQRVAGSLSQVAASVDQVMGATEAAFVSAIKARESAGKVESALGNVTLVDQLLWSIARGLPKPHSLAVTSAGQATFELQTAPVAPTQVWVMLGTGLIFRPPDFSVTDSVMTWARDDVILTPPDYLIVYYAET